MLNGHGGIPGRGLVLRGLEPRQWAGLDGSARCQWFGLGPKRLINIVHGGCDGRSVSARRTRLLRLLAHHPHIPLERDLPTSLDKSVAHRLRELSRIPFGRYGVCGVVDKALKGFVLALCSTARSARA